MDTWVVSDELIAFIHTHVPRGSTILELGSGKGTGLLAQDFNMISIEHDEKWVGLHRSKYIHAPLEKFRKQCAVFPNDVSWYNREVLRRELPKLPPYQLILVDGPPNRYGRGGFFKWIDLFRTDVPMVFDDAHRGREQRLMAKLSAKLQRPYTVSGTWTVKHFGYILP